jgi:ribosomal protein S18 acetylase RimI-like enzyme
MLIGPLISILILVLGGFYYKIYLAKPSAPPPATIEFQMEWKETRDSLHKPNTPMDVCRIMPQCFGESKTHRTTESCQKPMKDVFKYYNNALLIEKAQGKPDKVVGFLSSYPYRTRDVTMLMIYNVCIDAAYRNKGLGKRIVNESIEAVIEKFNLDRSKILLALDVDLRSPTAADAFALYAKMGFTRWISPCEGIHNYDFTKALQNFSTALPLQNDFIALYRNPEEYIKKVYDAMKPSAEVAASPEKLEKFNYPTHFCMYKTYEDSYLDIGDRLKKTISQMDLAYGKADRDDQSSE